MEKHFRVLLRILLISIFFFALRNTTHAIDIRCSDKQSLLEDGPRGRIKSSSGCQSFDEFGKAKKEGEWTFIFQDGEIIRGQFVSDKMQGVWVSSFPTTQETYQSFWSDGEPGSRCELLRILPKKTEPKNLDSITKTRPPLLDFNAPITPISGKLKIKTTYQNEINRVVMNTLRKNLELDSDKWLSIVDPCNRREDSNFHPNWVPNSLFLTPEGYFNHILNERQLRRDQFFLTEQKRAEMEKEDYQQAESEKRSYEWSLARYRRAKSLRDQLQNTIVIQPLGNGDSAANHGIAYQGYHWGRNTIVLAAKKVTRNIIPKGEKDWVGIDAIQMMGFVFNNSMNPSRNSFEITFITYSYDEVSNVIPSHSDDIIAFNANTYLSQFIISVKKSDEPGLFIINIREELPLSGDCCLPTFDGYRPILRSQRY